jgi:hypothetical protein
VNILQSHGINQQTVKKSVEIGAENESISFAAGDFDSLLDGTNPFSISFWIKPADVSDAGNLFSSVNTNSGEFDGIALASRGDASDPNRLRFYLIEDFSGGVLNPTDFIRRDFIHTMTNGNWYHIVATYDGSEDISGLTVYQNGTSLAADTAEDNNTGVGTGISTPSNLQFGNGNFLGNAFLGKYTDITIWDIELSSAQVNTLYNSGTPGNPRTQINDTNLRTWLRVDEDDIFFPTCRDSEGESTVTYVNIAQTNITTDVP